jgi:hypothetical protein
VATLPVKERQVGRRAIVATFKRPSGTEKRDVDQARKRTFAFLANQASDVATG